MQSSSQQSSNAPNGPSISSTSARNSKLDQIIQNFYTKTAQIIVQARCTPNNDSRYGKRNSLRGSSSNSRKLNKWFNIATEDVELLREDLKFWRSSISTTMGMDKEEEVPPMIIDIYLDTSKLSHNQSLVVADDNLRWSGVELKSQTSDSHIHRILIESWELTLKHPYPSYAVDLPNLYKRSIVFFRSLHSLVRLLPSYDLYRKLHKLNDSNNPLSIGYRLASTPVQSNTEISLDSTILENDARKPTLVYNFTDIITPMGTFKLNVTYRRNCDFKVEDSERDLSAQFIDMDEQFFTPTMAKYQQEYTRPRPVSAYTTGDRSSTLDNTARTKVENSPRPSFSTSPRHPTDPRDIKRQSTSSVTSTASSISRPQLSSSPAVRSEGVTSISTSNNRRASAPFVVSPFKSPFLSSSPQAESIFSGAGNSGGTRHHYTPPSSERSRGGGGGGVDSGSFGRKIEFSSSFDKYKSSPTNRLSTGSPSSNHSMMRRWSRTSDHSSINFKNDENDDDLEEFVKFVGSNQELKLFKNNNNSSTQLLSSGQNLSSESDNSTGGSMFKSNASVVDKRSQLTHFQNLRETHNSLSESLSSSIMMGNASGGNSSQHDPNAVSGISPVSSTSSTGRSYQPIIPSPLHAEQRSTSPVHIPRSFPQLRTLSNNQNPLRIARLNQSTHEFDDGSNDMSAYSTYPQDHHQQDLRLLRNAATTSNSNTLLGKATSIQEQKRAKSPTTTTGINFNRNSGNYSDEPHLLYNLQRSRNTDGGNGSSIMHDNSINSSGQGKTSMMDDDDSLVFKMSELECEGPQQQLSTSPKDKQTMLFSSNNNNRYNTTKVVVDFNTNNNHHVSTTNNNNNNRPQQEHFLELTPTPLSPPLLHRLQAISMSTVNEEEEKSSMSASGSSNSNHESPSKKTTNQLPFDAW